MLKVFLLLVTLCLLPLVGQALLQQAPQFRAQGRELKLLNMLKRLMNFMHQKLIAPKLMANDSHELRLAHETKNMLLNAEMMLRASLFRTESRGTHKREDFPNQDDKDWLEWVIIAKNGDNMKLTKRPIPDAWKPQNA